MTIENHGNDGNDPTKTAAYVNRFISVKNSKSGFSIPFHLLKIQVKTFHYIVPDFWGQGDNFITLM